MFDLQTHLLPDDAGRAAASWRIRHGLSPTRRKQRRSKRFEADYRRRRELNRKILDHLLHDAFGDDAQTEPEVDLVLDPDPPPQRDRSRCSGKYRFRDVRRRRITT